MPWKPRSHRLEANKRQSHTRQSYHRQHSGLYNNRWRRYSEDFRKANPICVICNAKGIIKPSKATDHIIPHKGDEALFWNPQNHQALCKNCHDTKSANERHGKYEQRNVPDNTTGKGE